MSSRRQKMSNVDFDKNIFINCPFDNDYINDILKPMLYIIIQNGYHPRLTLEVSDSSQFRLIKIIQIIKECKYSIHDLSKVKATKKGEYARMNMPFELGIDFGIKNTNDENMSKKQFLILEAVKYDYMKALSDISGFDIKVHKNKTKGIFECLYRWISETLKVNGQKPPLKYFYDYTDFNAYLYDCKAKEFNSEEIAKNYIDEISIPEYIEELKNWFNL